MYGHWGMIKDLKRNWLVVSKLTWGIWQILTWGLESLKNLRFNGLLVSKVYKIFELKQYRGVTFHDTEECYKIWRIIDLWFGKWHEEFDEFSPKHLKIWIICFLMGSIDQSISCFSLKSTEELCLMALKIDAKFEGKPTCAFKNDIRNLANFHR